jgi:tRNA pseudouridine55 synthase
MKDRVNGLLVLDKPGGMTSRAVVNRAQQWFARGTPIGHTGTLDPLATGVLILCLGSATRLSEYVQEMPKTYRSRLLLGARSDSDDVDGNVVPVAGAAAPDAATILREFQTFLGATAQVPPAYSAAKLTGRRAYDLARRGEEVVLQPRTVCIDAIDLLAYTFPHLDLEVRCGKGTYIRALARDLGERLGCGALVQTLRRTQIGPFSADAALPLHVNREQARAAVLPVEMAVAELPAVTLDTAALVRLRRGQEVPWKENAGIVDGKPLAIFAETGELAAIARLNPSRGCLSPVKVLQ